MEYEPLKRILNSTIRRITFLRRLLYLLMDALILRQWYVKREIKKIIKKRPVTRFYDAGAGLCQYSYYILQKYSGIEILSVDLNEEMLIAFSEYLTPDEEKRLLAVKADLQNYIPARKQDIIVATDILEHIEDDLAVLTNFREAINENGYLIISTPHTGKEAGFTSEHYREGYSKDELENKLREAGWEIIEYCHSYGFWGNLAWHLAMRFPLSIINRCKLLIILLPVYYLLVYLPVYLMMLTDFKVDNKKGKGIVLVARAVEKDNIS
jgi:SAM-dependent methyltransferase